MENNKHNILYVDDEIGNLRVFQASFKKQYNVFVAESGKEALELLATNDIQLIITDQKMPKMTGVELLERVVDLYPDIIKIILTGFTDVEDIMQALNKCGIYRYLMKPWEKDEMKQTIDKSLEIHQLRKYREELLEELQTNNELLEERIKDRTLELSKSNELLKQEIEERKIIEQNLQLAKEKAEEASKAKQLFLSTMSHEIRTPLNAVIGMAHLLQQSGLDEAQQENIQLLLFSAKNLLSLINDILDISRIESGKLEIEHLPFDFNDLIKNISNAHKSNAAAQNLAYHVRVDPAIPPVLLGDQTRLWQILNNLLGNAFKFTSKGVVSLDIDCLHSEPTKTLLRFSVSDTGIGIPLDKQEIIFEHFSQASSETTRKYGGTGLGLAICRKLIQAHGGVLKLESEEGKGSNFYFEVAFDIGSSEGYKTQQADNNITTTTTENLSHLKILLVEDNKINQILMRKFFAKWEVNYELAMDGLEAVEKVKSERFDLVLMDIQMPEMDGYGATQAIRQIDGEYYQKLPIIALTASTLQGEETRIKSVGMNDYIVKPFDPRLLAQKILSHTITGSTIHPDFTAFLELMDGDIVEYKELLQATLKDLHELIESLHKFNDQGEAKPLKNSTHNMKPPLEMLGLLETHAKLRALRSPETTDIKALYAIVIQEINTLADLIQQQIAS